MRPGEEIQTAGPSTTDTSPLSTASQASQGSRLSRIAPGFDLTSVRCAAEVDLLERIQKDKDFVARVEALAEEIDDEKIHTRLSLLTECYRVDEAITPRLFRLGRMLRHVLRLVRPLDMFVLPSSEMNAFCIPSRKGNRFVMCLHSALVNTISSHELLFVMGHEVGHALLKHGDMPGVSFDHPDFSPFEVVRLRALGRAKELSCDRIGLLACQNLRVASTALFKIASGLSDKWVSFDETAYSRHFDELSSMAEVVDMDDASRTHPLTPLRVKALMAYSKSEPHSMAFGRTRWAIAAIELERGVEAMLSVLSPDLSELESKKEQEAAGYFLYQGALMVIAADGVIDPEEVAWMSQRTDQKLSPKELAQELLQPGFMEQSLQRLGPAAAILRNKLSERNRAGLLYEMCEVAACGGGIPESEFTVLAQLRSLLDVPPEIAQRVLHTALSPDDDADTGAEQAPQETDGESSADVLDEILDRSRLTDKARPHAAEAVSQIRSEGDSLAVAIRKLVSWAIIASSRSGPLTEAQGKRMVISAIKVGREIRKQAGAAPKRRGKPMDQLVRESGVVAMFKRGEQVIRSSDRQPCLVVSVSKARGILGIAQQEDPESIEEVEPTELYKDPTGDAWPGALTDL